MADPDVLWSDPAHWTMWGYRCKADPRVIVPKRNRAMGWTMNWAHASAVPTMLVMMLVAAAPTLAVVALAAVGVIGVRMSVFLSVVSVPMTIWMIVAFCKHHSNGR